VAKKTSKSHKLSVYSNLSRSHKIKKDTEARKHAQYLASLPKNPIKRFFYRLKPKHLVEYWFSKHGLFVALKTLGVAALLIILLIGGMFAYFRKDLDSIRPGELSKRVQTTVTTYLDRNGQVLWEDTGTGDYKLVVDDNGLNKYLKQATVAIEDRNFYTEGGVSIPGLFRAVINNLTGGSTQGGSTLTQQLVKQVFFADEAQQRGISGIPRKIKEIILSIEVERMYNKTQILDLYLNESPYGGRRNGAESAAETYFGVSAKDLTLPEAALLAAIPQDPSVYNPYNVAGHDALIARQHTVLDDMADQGYITKTQAEDAKKFPIIDHLVPEANQYADIKAPHFVQMVKSELISELGAATVGNGGLTVKTTLDLNIQNKLQDAMNSMFSSYIPAWAGFTDGAATVEDVKTGQIVALLGSRDFNYAGFGQDNAAISYIQPGSTIKPLVYSELFQKKPTGQINYGSGSILNDTNINSLYGAPLYDSDHVFKGPMTIRAALATSRNIPAVEAMYISGVKPTLDNIHSLGATSYCTQGSETQVGLASAIGGCGVKQVDLVNAYASLARGGAYIPQSTILQVTNSSGEVLKKWSATAPVQVVDPQSAYILADILTDDNARAPLDGHNALGMAIPGVKTATKTGTSDSGGSAKDIWMMSYSPALAMGVWLGNPDTSILKNGTSSLPGAIIATVMSYAHKDVYAPEGLWKSGDWFTQPSGIQKVGNEIYPSWWSPTQGQTNTNLNFDKVSKKKATSCTPTAAIISVPVTKSTDPITKKDVYIDPTGIYDGSKDDDAHSCSDTKPSGNFTQPPTQDDPTNKNSFKFTVNVTPGSSSHSNITGVTINIDGTSYPMISAPAGSSIYTYSYIVKSSDTESQITATITDANYYTNDGTISIPMPKYSI
jgi:penicillin-binding protein 1A